MPRCAAGTLQTTWGGRPRRHRTPWSVFFSRRPETFRPRRIAALTTLTPLLCLTLAAQTTTPNPAPKKQKPSPASQVQTANPDETQPLTPTPPPKEQTVEITPPQISDPFAPIWYGVIGLSILSIAALAFTGWRLKTAPDTAPTNLDSIRDQIRTLSNAASRAKLRYDELLSRANRPAASLAPPARIEPQPHIRDAVEPRISSGRTREIEEERPTVRTTGPRINLRPGRTPEFPPARPPAAVEKPAPPADADLVHAYNLARSSERGARDRFDTQFPYVRISCTNHEDWQYHKNVTLRFEREDFGWYLMVTRGGKCFALPWFTQDLSSERESFQGVFDYPEGIGTKLRIGRAALLQPQGDSWTLISPGEVRSDA